MKWLLSLMAFSSLDEKAMSGRKSLPRVPELVGGRARIKGRVPTHPHPLHIPTASQRDGPSKAMISKLFTFRSRTFFRQHLKQKERCYVKQPAAPVAGWAPLASRPPLPTPSPPPAPYSPKGISCGTPLENRLPRDFNQKQIIT